MQNLNIDIYTEQGLVYITLDNDLNTDIMLAGWLLDITEASITDNCSGRYLIRIPAVEFDYLANDFALFCQHLAKKDCQTIFDIEINKIDNILNS